MGATHAYVARRPCSHPIELCVDEPEHPGEVAKFVSKAIRAGYTVERVTIEEARAIGVEYCSCVTTEPIGVRKTKKPDRRQTERRADRRRQDDKTKARLKR